MPSIFRLFFGLTALLAVFFSTSVMADPSGRVGRLSLLEGPSLFRIDRDDPGSQATLNWPVSSGAILDTERGSRAEIWIGSTAFRVAAESRLEFGIVDDRQVLLNLATGTLTIILRERDQADDIEVRTPHGRFKFSSAGSYRIDVGTLYSNFSTISGNAYVANGERPINIGPNRMVSMERNGAVTSYGDLRRDHFDDWTASRDAATQVISANQYISPEMTGYQDLERHGEWSSLPEYGSVWYPRAVPSGWAPYRDGRWAWVTPWGWTWIDAAPWGFAPFHYGRWLEVRGRWAWAPGSYVARPVYAPALVAWVGDAGWTVRFSAGSAPAIGWFPLAPREVYVPSYRVSDHYVRQVNVTHVTNSNIVERALSERSERHFAHRDSARAVTVVPAHTLRDSSRISGADLPGSSQTELRQAPVSGHAPSSNWVAPSNSVSRVDPSGTAGLGREIHGSPRTPTRLDPIDSMTGRKANDVLRNTIETRGVRSRNNVDAIPPEAFQRPLPPGITRLPAEPRAPETTATPRPSSPSSDVLRSPLPTAVAPALVPVERRRFEPKEVIAHPHGAPRSPSSLVTGGPIEHPIERPTERLSERRNERPMMAGEPRPQMRGPALTPQLPAPISDRSRNEYRPLPMESRFPPVAVERMPPMERRSDRSAPMFSELPRRRDVAPPAPSSPAMPIPAREAAQTDRRHSAPELRPAHSPRDIPSRHPENEKRH